MTTTLDALRSLAACADHARDAAYALELAGIEGDVRDGAERIVTLANAVRRLLEEEAVEQIKERRAG
ncbi:MAG: hypothetical protein EKK55_07785 [Rhodocyclaceae bacterium]|nr:MAG: hypothetical protein EKK55_07785 [Rhodocyclaceae bacterium]